MVVLLVLEVGIVLFLFPHQTDQLFAWTIKSPMTAACLGASYWASIPLSLLGSFRRTWADMRLAFHGVGIFLALTLLAPLIHLDKFHTNDVSGIAWIIVYIVAPIIIFGIMLRMGRAPGEDPPRTLPLAHWERGLLLVMAFSMLVLGAALFIAPAWAAEAWPWTLTPLTGRAIGAWVYVRMSRPDRCVQPLLDRKVLAPRRPVWAAGICQLTPAIRPAQSENTRAGSFFNASLRLHPLRSSVTAEIERLPQSCPEIRTCFLLDKSSVSQVKQCEN